MAEHLRLDSLEDEDLVSLAPAGHVHLKLVDKMDYLSSIAEEIYFDDKAIAKEVAISLSNKENQYSLFSMARNAEITLDYLARKSSSSIYKSDSYLNCIDWEALLSIDQVIESVRNNVKAESRKDLWLGFCLRIKENKVVEGTVTRLESYGVFVRISSFVGLAHETNLGQFKVKDFAIDDRVEVEVTDIENSNKNRIPLRILANATNHFEGSRNDIKPKAVEKIQIKEKKEEVKGEVETTSSCEQLTFFDLFGDE